MGPTPPATGFLGVSWLIRQDREAFAAGGFPKPFIAADEGITLWGLVAPDQRCRQLERVSGAERGCRRNHVNVSHQGFESFERLREHRGRQTPFSMTPVERRLAFDRAYPPKRRFPI